MKKMVSAALVIGAAAAGIAIQSGVAGAIEADGLYDTDRKCWDAIEEASRNGTYNAPPFTYYCKQTPSGKWIITR